MPGPRRLRRLSPLALLGAAALLSIAALLSGSVALNLAIAGVTVLTALAAGAGVRETALLSAPALVASMSVGVSNALLSGAVLGGDPGTAPSVWDAAALPASRVLAVALPGLVAARGLDPTALADALMLVLRVPARTAISALAALRLLPLLQQEWTILGMATRARGIAARGPAARLSLFASMAFRLLVAALRRAVRLAEALEARGLRAASPRTIARPLVRSRGDWPMLVGCALFLVGALTSR